MYETPYGRMNTGKGEKANYRVDEYTIALQLCTFYQDYPEISILS